MYYMKIGDVQFLESHNGVVVCTLSKTKLMKSEGEEEWKMKVHWEELMIK